MSPPDYEREVPSLSHPPPWGFNAPYTKNLIGPKLQARGKTWCRARDLNPHGKPIRPSSVRVCQFRQPGTDSRDHYTAPVRSPARRAMKSEATRLLSEKGKVRRGDNEQNCADGSEAGKERFSRPRTVEHPGAAADRAQPLALRPLQQNDADDEECQHKMKHENSYTHAPPPTCTCRNLNTCHGTMTAASCQPCAFALSDTHTKGPI